MIPSLVILCLAAFALVSIAVSAGLGLGLWSWRRSIERLAPAAQARLYLLAALLPLLASTIVIVAALAPSFGWIADHCSVVGDPHSHPHVCAAHHVAAWPAISVTVLAGLVALRLLVAVGARLIGLGRSYIKQRSLTRRSSAGHLPGVRVLPIQSEAQAFVLGLFRPTLFVTQGLVTGAERRHLDAVLAHERAHIRRRDPLRRFAAGVGLSLHLPGVARWLDQRLLQAQEMAADTEAAGVVGGANVARALVALAKSSFRVPRSAFAFSGPSIEARVLLLIDPRERRDWPRASTLAAGGVVAMVVAGVGADALHHGVEMLLGLLGG